MANQGSGEPARGPGVWKADHVVWRANHVYRCPKRDYTHEAGKEIEIATNKISTMFLNFKQI